MIDLDFEDVIGNQVDISSLLPSQAYLQQIFQKLEKSKQTAQYENLPTDTVYQGFKTIPIQKLEAKEIAKTPNIIGEKMWKKDKVRNIYCYEESCPLSKICYNGFFSAFHEAYINHGDVKITPDDIWMAIMLFFTKYVDENAQKLRHAFVSHEGKKQLIIKTDQEKSEYKWDEFFEKVMESIKENTVKGVTQNFQCSFSTTDKFFTFFSTAIIMNSFKKYFDYTRMICSCGIQNIHMGGTLEDWQKLSNKLTLLKEFDVDGKLKTYVSRLQPVLGQFIETYKGRANIEFWNNIYHERKNPYAGPYQPQIFANGWILRFFTLNDVMQDGVAIQETDVPIKVVNTITKRTKKMSLVGGCRGISIENGVYRPHYSFSIVEKFNSS